HGIQVLHHVSHSSNRTELSRLMNRLPALAISSIVAVSLPGASAADERLDAPGPGYRQQVERFSPRGVPANPFQPQVGSTLFSVESPDMIRTGELFSLTAISAPVVSFEAGRLDARDPCDPHA